LTYEGKTLIIKVLLLQGTERKGGRKGMANNFFDRIMGFLKLNDDDLDDEYDDYDDEDSEPAPEPVKKRQERYEEPEEEREKISPLRRRQPTVVPSRQVHGSEICMIRPKSVDEGREICDTLLSGRAVVINLEGINMDVAQRVIDFTSGACYSMNGNLQKISSYIFIVTPQSMELSGDFQDIVNGSLDMSSFSTSH